MKRPKCKEVPIDSRDGLKEGTHGRWALFRQLAKDLWGKQSSVRWGDPELYAPKNTHTGMDELEQGLWNAPPDHEPCSCN